MGNDEREADATQTAEEINRLVQQRQQKVQLSVLPTDRLTALPMAPQLDQV